MDVQCLALDFAALHHVLSESFQDGFLLKLESQRFHVTNQTALLMTDGGKRLCEAIAAPAELGPAGELMDLPVYSPHIVR
jgi:hypothetical protein